MCMQLKPNAFRLHENVRGVETMSRFALAVLALDFLLTASMFSI